MTSVDGGSSEDFPSRGSPAVGRWQASVARMRWDLGNLWIESEWERLVPSLGSEQGYERRYRIPSVDESRNRGQDVGPSWGGKGACFG